MNSLPKGSSPQGSPALQQNGASPTSSEVSGDSPRELTSPLSAQSLQPEVDEVGIAFASVQSVSVPPELALKLNKLPHTRDASSQASPPSAVPPATGQ